MSLLPPEQWGPPLWRTFHAYAVNHDPSIPTKDVTRWFEDFATKIPCDSCRTKYLSILRSTYRLTPEITKSKKGLFEWTVTVHNAVNMFLRKPLVTPEEAAEIHGFVWA